MIDLIERIFTIKTEEAFNKCALDVFTFQREHVPVYQSFFKILNPQIQQNNKKFLIYQKNF
jgi:hypothetical protein